MSPRTLSRRGGAVRGRTGARPVAAPDVAMPPGSLLSCYTAPIAYYLACIGADAELAVGTQLYLAVRIDAEQQLSFVHHHTPLRGDRPTHRVELLQHRADDPEKAVTSILGELQRTGAVILAGDIAAVPWQADYGRRHAPHWLVVDRVNHAAGTAHVTDAFEFDGVNGEQRSYQGWVSYDLLAALAQPPEAQNPVWEGRHRHAFGEAGDEAPAGRHQWFVARRLPEARSVDADAAWDMLRRTLAHHGGATRRPDLEGAEWHCGTAALGALAGWLEPRLDDPATYDVADDIWVAARNRQLFARVLTRLSDRPDDSEVSDLAGVAALATEVAEEWSGVPRMLAYNAQSLAMGRRTRAYPVTQLRHLAAREEELLAQLALVLPQEAPS